MLGWQHMSSHLTSALLSRQSPFVPARSSSASWNAYGSLPSLYLSPDLFQSYSRRSTSLNSQQDWWVVPKQSSPQQTSCPAFMSGNIQTGTSHHFSCFLIKIHRTGPSDHLRWIQNPHGHGGRSENLVLQVVLWLPEVCPGSHTQCTKFFIV